MGGSFNDGDGDYVGVAVAGLTGTGNGTWQYSLDAGVTWTAFGSVSAGSARLLSGADLIRFAPSAGFRGTATLQAFAWDQTTGTDGGTADLSGAGSTGGSTAFGTTLLTATVQVVVVPPTSSVNPLPGVLNTTSFLVSWSGSAGGNGSVIAAYDIYVSVDGGAYVPWISGTSQTSAVFTGSFGHRYAFASVATDQAGNRQPGPGAPQASTTLVAPLPPGINAELVTVKMRKKKWLKVEVFNAVTGVLETSFLSPFQSPKWSRIQMRTSDNNHDGVPDTVVLTARKGKHTVTVFFPE
jgi:hypothetical protein